MKTRFPDAHRISLIFLAFLPLVGCGGGGNSGGGTVNPSASTVTSVTVSPTSATLTAGGTQQFTAMVNGTGNSSQAVTWTVIGVGTVSTSGNYTAPALVSSPTSATVKATSVQNSGVSGGATVTVNPAPPSALSYPGPVQATVGIAITLLSPTVTGIVTSYSVSPPLPTGLSLNMTSGVISGTPTVSAAENTYVITASNVSGSATFGLSLTVRPAAPAIAISAASLTFSDQLVSTVSAAQKIAIINTGTGPLSVNSITISGSAASSFADTSTCGSVAANGTCIISVTFTPSVTGSLSASLGIASNASTNPVVKLFGSGVSVDISLNNTIIPAGQSATLTWSAMNATSCSASGSWSGSEPTSGSQIVTQTAPGYYTYTLTCPGSGTSSVVLTAYGPTPTVTEQNPNDLAVQADFYVAPPNQLVGLQTNLTVPLFPPVPQPAAGVPALYLWPGLGPATNSVNFLPINNGVLQSVLSWGTSCAPTPQPPAFSSWWISAQYVNTFGADQGHTGCFSGSSMAVNPGDVLLVNMTLDATSGIWTQIVTDSNTDQSVTFSINMQAQGQNWAYFVIEAWYGATINTPVIFTNTVLTFQSPDTAGWCSTSQGGDNAYVMTPPTPQNSGTQCFISSVVLTQ